MLDINFNQIIEMIEKRWWDCDTTGDAIVLDKQFTYIKWSKKQRRKTFLFKIVY